MMTGSEDVAGVRTRADFVKLVRSLAADAGDEWENATLPRYLEALAAWVEDMDGFYHGQRRPVPEIAWQAVAEMMVAATLYE